MSESIFVLRSVDPPREYQCIPVNEYVRLLRIATAARDLMNQERHPIDIERVGYAVARADWRALEEAVGTKEGG